MTYDLGSTYERELAGGDSIWTLDCHDTSNRQGSALWEIEGAVKQSRERGEPVIPLVLILHGDGWEQLRNLESKLALGIRSLNMEYGVSFGH